MSYLRTLTRPSKSRVARFMHLFFCSLRIDRRERRMKERLVKKLSLLPRYCDTTRDDLAALGTHTHTHTHTLSLSPLSFAGQNGRGCAKRRVDVYRWAARAAYYHYNGLQRCIDQDLTWRRPRPLGTHCFASREKPYRQRSLLLLPVVRQTCWPPLFTCSI